MEVLIWERMVLVQNHSDQSLLGYSAREGEELSGQRTASTVILQEVVLILSTVIVKRQAEK